TGGTVGEREGSGTELLPRTASGGTAAKGRRRWVGQGRDPPGSVGQGGAGDRQGVCRSATHGSEHSSLAGAKLCPARGAEAGPAAAGAGAGTRPTSVGSGAPLHVGGDERSGHHADPTRSAGS